MQCKDIDDRPILEFLAARQGHWCFRWDLGGSSEYNVTTVMPPNVPEKLALAKMKRLIDRGLVNGCTCGCRGDFEITEKGLQAINTTSNNDSYNLFTTEGAI